MRSGRECRRHGLAALTLAVTVFGVLATSASAIPSRRLVWNASASAPIGLYWRLGDRPERGDLVLAWAPLWARRLAAERHYLPRAVPLLKRIVADTGDTVCASGAEISVNGAVVARRLDADPLGRPLPHWKGCKTLGAGEVLLLMSDVPDSFDGRYFGITVRPDVLGRLVPLWIR